MKKKGKKKVAAAPLVAKKAAEPKKVVNPLLEKRPRNYGIGNESRPCGVCKLLLNMSCSSQVI